MRVSELCLYVCVIICIVQISHGAGHEPDLVFTCKEGWNLYQGVCYLAVNISMTRAHAVETCRRQGGELFMFKNQQQFYSLKNDLPDSFWTGAMSNWELDSNDEILQSISIWANYEPIKTNGHCISVDKEKGAFIQDCQMMNNFVCQYDACLQGFVPCALGSTCIKDSSDLCNNITNCVDKSDERNCPAKCKNYMMLTESSGEFSTERINDWTDCWWALEAPIGKWIRVDIPAMTLEKNCAYLQIWTGSPSVAMSNDVKRLTGTLGAQSIYSSNNFLHLRLFAEDVTVSTSPKTIKWTTEIPSVTREDTVLTASPQYKTLEFPFGGADMGPDMIKLTWKIMAPEGQVISYNAVSETAMDRADTPIYVTDGGMGSWQAIETFNYYTTATNNLWVMMENSNTIRDYSLSYISGCNITLSSLKGRISSPGSSLMSIPHEIVCKWTLLAGENQDPDQGMSISFPSVILSTDPRQSRTGDDRESKDTLLVFIDGNTTAEDPPVPFDNNVENIIHAPGGRIELQLITDVALNSKLFIADFGKDCEPLQLSEHTIKSTEKSFYGESVMLSCPEGYQFNLDQYKDKQTATVTCKSAGFVIDDSLIIPECQIVRCGTPRTINNGFIQNSTNTSSGGQAWYTCSQGFAPEGDQMVTCKADGKWSQPPTCTSAQCSVMNDELVVSNGGYRVEAGNNITTNYSEYNIIVEFYCNPGYELIGQKLTHCGVDGWSHKSTPTCQKKRCLVPQVTYAEEITSRTIDFDSSLQINCLTGFRGSGNVKCLENQTLNQEITCTDKDECTEGNSCEDATTTCVNTNGNYTCECLQGYQRGSSQYACTDIPECATDKGGCSNDCVERSGYYECTCGTGFELFTEDGLHGFMIPESETGFLAGDLYRLNHTCVPKSCPELSNIANGTYLKVLKTFHYEDNITLQCDDGYHITGLSQSITSQEIECLSGGSWSNSFSCSARICSIPSAPKYGSFDRTSVAFKESVKLNCNYTTTTQMTQTAHCIYDNGTMRLGGEEINKCPVIDCGQVMLPDGGAFDGSSPLSTDFLDARSNFMFKCDTGYDISGDSNNTNEPHRVTCKVNGRWEFGTLRCLGKKCTDPRTPVDAIQIAESYEQGKMLRYECVKPGFKPLLLGEDRNYTCEYNQNTDSANWSNNLTSDNLPVCTDVTSPVVTFKTEDRSYFPMQTVEVVSPTFDDNFGINTESQTNYMATGDVILNKEEFSYSVTDFMNNSVTHSFTYNILVREDKPNLSCPLDKTILVNSTDDGIQQVKDFLVTYDESATLVVTPSTIQVTIDKIGTAQKVSVTLVDTFGRKSECTFLIHYTARRCFEQALYPDANAQRSCKETSNGLSCNSTCNDNFIYKDGSKTKTFQCNTPNNWNFPQDLDIFCLSTENPAYLADVDLIYAVVAYPASFCSSPFSNTIASQLNIFKEKIGVICNGMNWGISVEKEPEAFSLAQISVTLRMNLDNTDKTTEERQACVNQIQNLDLDVFNITNDIIDCSGVTKPIYIQSLSIGNPVISCITTSYHLLEDTDVGNVCVPCGPGFYFDNTTNSCAECSANQYQYLTDQTECIDCPSATAPDPQKIDCDNTCPPGFTSSDGFFPCNPCPVDEYWVDSKTCASCPSPKKTAGLIGTDKEGGCYDECPVGHYSETGLNIDGCRPCPHGFYQQGTGSTQCSECSAAQTTNGTGKTSPVDCNDLESCSSFDCDTAGTNTCIYQFHRAVCVCNAGFGGEKCGQKHEICNADPCTTGSTCAPISGGTNTDFTCTCRTDLDRCEMQSIATDVEAANLNGQYNFFSFISKDSCEESCLNEVQCQTAIYVDSFNGCYLYNDSVSTKPLTTGGSSYLMNKTCTIVFSGDRCETDLIDDCATAGCAVESMCMDKVDDFKCLCPEDSGFEGELCSQAVDVCNPDPCANGECTAYGTVRYLCTCNEGYTGENCDTMIDECSFNPNVCLGRGFCNDPGRGYHDYQCACANGFYGKNCEQAPDFCAQNDCLNNVCWSRIFDMNGTCACEGLFQNDGPFACDKTSQPCDDFNCNNGNCFATGDGLSASCTCSQGWTGSSCQHNIDDCTNTPCLNGATCNDLVNSFNCSCADGFEGDNCAIDIDECTDGICKNGTCKDGANSYTCNCLTGYTGNNCETDIDECASFPCQHGGECKDGQGAYTCTCESGWTGTNCEASVNNCGNNPCLNDGTCYSILNNSVCRCQSGTEGQFCDKPSNLCDVLSGADLCQNNGDCLNNEGTAICMCETEFSVERCYFEDGLPDTDGGLAFYDFDQVNIDSCTMRCLHDKKCAAFSYAQSLCYLYNLTSISLTNSVGNLHVRKICPTDYSGDSCQFIKDWCSQDICENGGTCSAVSPHGYQCECQEGYSGVNCEIAADPCSTSPCGNSGASCKSTVTEYICQCPEGKVFTGLSCKAPDTDYSLLVNTMNGEETSCLSTPFHINSAEISVLLRIKVYAKTENPVLFNLFGGPELMPAKSTSNLALQVLDTGITIRSGNNTEISLPYDNIFGNSLFDGEWHVIGIAMNRLHGNVSSIIDVTKETSTIDIGQSSQFNDNVQICLGTGVLAEYSKISIFDYSLTHGNFISAFSNTFTPSKKPVQNFWNYNVKPSTKILKSALEVSPLPGATDISPTLDCNGITETVEFVLDSRFISLNGLTNITDNLVQIKDNAPGLTLKHSLPDELLWGYYEGIVVGMDENGNYGQCRFPVYIKYNEQCPQPVSQGSNGQLCDSGDGVCSVSCNSSDAVAAKLPRYMPCSRLGVFDTQAPKNDLILPACNAAASPKYVVSASMQFQFDINCENVPDAEDTSKLVLTENIEDLQDKWTDICNDDCSNIQFVTTTCDTDMPKRFNVMMEVQLETPFLTYAGVSQINAEDALRIIIKLDEALSLNRLANGILVKDTVQISQSEVCTTSGYAMIRSGTNTYCVPCGPGRYYMGTEMENDCVLCPRGMYQNELGQMECKPCGNFANGNPRTTYQMGAIQENQCVEVCSAGQFYKKDENKCVNCDRHYYQDEEGQNYCKPCSVGYKTIKDGSTRADDCKEDCPAGKYRDADTQQCLNCSRGSWRSLEYDDCKPCDNGRTTMIDEFGTSALSCNMDDCPAGKYWSEVNETCFECELGYFQPDRAMLMCEKCPKNYTTPTSMSKHVNNCTFYCAMGYEEDTDKEDTCKPCQRGFYKDNMGQAKFEACKMCNGGNTTDIIGAVSVDNCSVPICSQGQVIVDGECVNCVIDSYSEVEIPYTATECVTCSDECETCGNLFGTKFTGAKSQDNCTFYCEAGYEVGNSGSCQECNRGYYKDNKNDGRFDMCVPCRDGQTTDETGSIDVNNCSVEICSAGQFIKDGVCQNCSENTFQNMDRPFSYTNCTECAPIGGIPTGTMENASNSSSLCLPICDGGKTYDNVSKTCANCSMGTYKPASFKFDTCFSCIDGYTTSGTGAVEENECNIRDCLPGTFINETAVECDACPVGQYQDQPRKTACVTCGENLSTAQKGSNSSDACQVYCNPGLEGKTIPGSDEKQCTKCPEHFYKEQAGLTTCEKCPPNWTSNDTRIACTVSYCYFGYQYNSSGDGFCEMCREGYYKDVEGNEDQCTPCLSGWTTNGTGQSSCSLRFCVPGEYYNNNLGNCSECAMGSYKGDAGNKACTDCPSNKTTTGIGATMESQCDIDICPVGQFRKPSEKTCSDCAKDSYQNETGKTSCISCEEGYITLEAKSTLSTDCVPECQLGQQYIISSKTCMPCPAGSYKDSVGNNPDSCQACQSDKTTVGTGATSQTDCSQVVCPIGTYSETATGRVVCKSCPKGTYSSQRGQSQCTLCETDQTTLRDRSDGVNRCIPLCNAGWAYDVISKKSCQPCKVGQFNDIEGGVCKVCATGWTNLAAGTTGCSIIDSNQAPFSTLVTITYRVKMTVVIDDCANLQTSVIIQSTTTRFKTHFLEIQETSYRTQNNRFCVNARCDNINLSYVDGSCKGPNGRRRKRAANFDIEIDVDMNNVSSTLVDNQDNAIPVEDAIASILTTDNVDLSPEPGIITLSGFSNFSSLPICLAGEKLDGVDCVKCPVGTYGEAGICKQCGTDKYQNATGQTMCNECPENTLNDNLGSPSVDACENFCEANVLYCNNRGTCYVTERRNARCECFSDYNGDTCSNKKEPSSNMSVILGAAIGGGGALLILLLVVVAVYRYLSNNDHKKKKKKRYVPDDELMYDRHAYDNFTMTAASNQARPIAPYPSIGYPVLGYRPDTSFDEAAYASVYRNRPSINDDAGQDTFVWQA